MLLAIMEPMETLLLRFRRAAEVLDANIAAMEGRLVRRRDDPPRAAEPPNPIVRLETGTADLNVLLAFQERLAELDGVTRVTVAGAGSERTTFLVELQATAESSEVFQTECSRCGKILNAGALPASHGLCEACVQQFLT